MSVIPNCITSRLSHYSVRIPFRGGLTFSETLDVVYGDENFVNEIEEISMDPPESNVENDEESANEDDGGMAHNLTVDS